MGRTVLTGARKSELRDLGWSMGDFCLYIYIYIYIKVKVLQEAIPCFYRTWSNYVSAICAVFRRGSGIKTTETAKIFKI